MNDTIVQKTGKLTSEDVLRRLLEGLPEMTPELSKAASFLVENPNDIGVSSMRTLASGAGVKPNTLVRMARSIGFDSYESFRDPFREEVRSGRDTFPDRARWLQSLKRGGAMERLYAETAHSAIAGIENLFSGTNAPDLQKAAADIIDAQHVYVLGVGVAHALARNFAYLASMALDTVEAIPRSGALPMDDLARAGRGDVLIAMTFKPYRREVVEAINIAHELGMKVIGISDSPASPVLHNADHKLIVPTDSPQFFVSTVALTALLETLVGFVIAGAGEDIIAKIDQFHSRRAELGIYLETDS